MGNTNKPQGMTPDQGLTLPSPARELWLETRDIVKKGLEQIQQKQPEYALTGGTILAARWHHRKSFDIDILVAENTPLHRGDDREETDFYQQIAAAGGTARYSRELNKFKITFPNSSEIDLWARSPILGNTTKREPVEKQEEAVLSNAQIIRGKLERGDMNLVRDVYDVLKAGTYDPKALEVAVNAIPRPLAEGLAWSWHHANLVLHADARTQLHGTEEPEAEHRHLGTRAAGALHASLYERLEIQVSKDLITIEILTTGQVPRTYRMTADEADDEFEERGLNAHLANKRPGAEVLREHAKVQASETTRSAVIYQEEQDATTYYEPMRQNPAITLAPPTDILTGTGDKTPKDMPLRGGNTATGGRSIERQRTPDDNGYDR